MKICVALATVVMMMSANAEPNVYWVDRQSGVDAAGRGSETAPFASIQAAVDVAESGSTIKVRPGVYDNGGQKDEDSKLNRVYIKGKALKVVSTGGKDVTHIVGRHSTDPDHFGMGAGAVRCVYLFGAAGTVIEGFTIRDGATNYYNPSNDYKQDSGAGVLCQTSGKAYRHGEGCVVDCVISNCVGIRGGALRGATAVRCFIAENRATNSGSAGRVCDFINCYITRNYDATAYVYEDCGVVNCTIVNNYNENPAAGVNMARLYNSLVF